ncbi:hypothetical protein KVV02_006578 [Mortierella alpina]|uniref:Uncharacterized protein n=1 Tax=Mortierella alpina TaxID=64518 RepID=A0A9P8A4S4_MORAP|nr:hypothetical protein KVV02_006578 [Mortierella alpina]
MQQPTPPQHRHHHSQEQTSSSARNALALSEIRSLVGIFLLGSNRDLIHCMGVCKDWRPDFRRLLYYDLQLTGQTHGAIISPLQWRAYGSYTRSLAIEEPTVSHQGAKSNLKKKYSRSARDSQDSGTLRSPDYNLDSALHCPNLQHLTVKLNTRNLSLCCWTRQDDEWDLDREGSPEAQDKEEQERNSLFNTTVALRYSQKMDAYFVKTSNRILALLHHHPHLKSFNWVGVSDTHMVQLGRYLLKRTSSENPMQLVELRLQHLRASVQELNRIIVNCPRLLRLHLRTLMLDTTSNWPELSERFGTDAALAPVHPSQLDNEGQEPQPRNRKAILDLQKIQSLTLDEPHFPPLQLLIDGPSLRHLQLAMCQAPPGFNATTGAHLNQPPVNQVEAPSPHAPPAFSVSWACPQLTHYTHDQAPQPAAVFCQNLLDSSQYTLTSLALTSHTLETTFISSLISNNHHCSTLTHLDLTNSAWIKSADVHLLLCHCPELLEFIGPQGVLWGEDLLRSQKSWACVKLRRLRLLICLARPDSELWELCLRDDTQRDPGQELGQSGAVPLFFPMQRILRIQSDDVVILETVDPEAEAAAAEGDNEEEGDGEQEAQTREEDDTAEVEQGQGQFSSSTSNTIWLRDVQDSVLEQLSKLTELESLDLSGGFKAFRFLVEHPRGIPWALDAGLDRLKGLSRMKELVVTGWENKMERQEVKWMKQHWPQLRSIINKSGNLTEGVVKTGANANDPSSRAWTRKTRAGDDLVVGWLAFEICLAQEWPERFSYTSAEDHPLKK